jgi:hypothetical protein
MNLYELIENTRKYRIEKKIVKNCAWKELVNTVIYRGTVPLVVEHCWHEITMDSILNALYNNSVNYTESINNKNKQIEALQKDLDSIRNIVCPWWDYDS